MCVVSLLIHPTEQVQVKMKQEVGVELTGEKYFADFFLAEDSSFLSNDGNGKSVDMKIVFKRCLSIEALDTFLPSLLLILLSYITSFFKLPKFFNTAITVNLSVMLTLTTLLISVLKKLPPTSYIKWIEFWLIFALMVPFSQVVLLTAIQWDLEMRKDIKDEKMKMALKECWLNDGENKVDY